MNDKIEKYMSQNIDNPIYLFHGSPKKLTEIKTHLSHDSNNDENNIANAVFLFPSFLKATPYAFKDSIKENSKDLDWDFIIPNDDNFPLMKMKNVNIDESIIGYIYVFEKSEDMIKDEKTYQYKCFHDLIPIDVVKITYREFKHYFKIEN